MSEREREREKTHQRQQRDENARKKTGEEWDSFHMMNNERRRYSLFLSLSLYIYIICRSFVDRVLHRIIATTHKHARCQSRWIQKKRGVQTYEKKNHCLSCINKQYTVVDTLFFPHHLLLFFWFFVFFFFLPDFSYSYIFACLKKQEITCPVLSHRTRPT